MFPPWDDGEEHQSDYQLAEFLRTVDPEAVARDRRRIHTPTSAEVHQELRRSAELWRLSQARKRSATNRAIGESEA